MQYQNYNTIEDC